MSHAPQPAMTAIRKAAVLLALLGDEVSTEICKHLGKHELRLLAQEISDLGDITAEMATQVLKEYHGMVAKPKAHAPGGPTYASKLVVKTPGKEGTQARPLAENVTRAEQLAARNADALEKADPKQLAMLLQQEHPQTIALILSQLHGDATNALLMLLPEEIRTSVINRLALMRTVSPEIVNEVTSRLLRKLKPAKDSDRRTSDRVRAVANLLNRIDGEAKKGILEAIEHENGSLAASIQHQMLTLKNSDKEEEAYVR